MKQTLEQELSKKQEELKNEVERYNVLQKTLSEMGQNLFRLDGAIKQLQELINKKEDK